MAFHDGKLTADFADMKEIISINLPCFVKDHTKGMEMCGGEELIKSTIKNKSSYMQLKLNSQADPLRHHITGCKVKSASLLLKLVRQKPVKYTSTNNSATSAMSSSFDHIDPSSEVTENVTAANCTHSSTFNQSLPALKTSSSASSSCLVNAMIIGKISECYCFDEIADYQYLSAAACPPDKTIVDYTTGLMIPPNSHETLLESIPRPFTKNNIIPVITPIFQDRKKHMSLPLRNQKRLEKKKRNQFGNFSLTCRKVGTPAPLYILKRTTSKSDEIENSVDDNNHIKISTDIFTEAIQEGNTRKVNFQRKEIVLRTLISLFSKIPIISRKHLLLAPSLNSNTYLLHELIPKVAYVYNEGPYKGLLVRLGFDPESSSDSRMKLCRFYQSINCRLSDKLYNSIIQRLWYALGRSSSYKQVDLDNFKIYDVTELMTKRSIGRATHVSSKVAPYTSSSIHDRSTAAIGQPYLSGDIKNFNDYITCLLFGCVVKKQFTTQICSINDEYLIRLVRSLTPNNTFDAQTGWFTKPQLYLIRQKILDIIESRLVAFINFINSNSDHLNHVYQDSDTTKVSTSIPLPIAMTNTTIATNTNIFIPSSAEHFFLDQNTTESNIDEDFHVPLTLYPYKWVPRYFEGFDQMDNNRFNSSIRNPIQENINLNNQSYDPDDIILMTDEQINSYMASKECANKKSKNADNIRHIKQKLKHTMKSFKKLDNVNHSIGNRLSSSNSNSNQNAQDATIHNSAETTLSSSSKIYENSKVADDSENDIDDYEESINDNYQYESIINSNNNINNSSSHENGLDPLLYESSMFSELLRDIHTMEAKDYTEGWEIEDDDLINNFNNNNNNNSSRYHKNQDIHQEEEDDVEYDSDDVEDEYNDEMFSDDDNNDDEISEKNDDYDDEEEEFDES